MSAAERAPGPSRPTRLLEDAVGVAFPGAVALCSVHGEVVIRCAVGDATLDTRYDLASLTKPIVVGSLLLRHVAEGRLSLDEPVFNYGPLEALAGHRSGLPAHRPFFRGPLPLTRARVLVEPPIAPIGAQTVYSDLGYMALGWHLEKRLGAPLDRLWDQEAQRLGLATLTYHPDPSLPIAPTEDCSLRRRVLRGEVHDPNAWALGLSGEAGLGHAGLFGAVACVHGFAQRLLDAWHDRPSPFDGPTLRRFLRPRPHTSWRLVFDSRSVEGYTSAGRYFGPAAFGHLGFTGTSLWIDPDREWICVLLSNRVHPHVDPRPAIRALRPQFHDAFAERFGAVVDAPQTR